jgi:hypothetical protein
LQYFEKKKADTLDHSNVGKWLLLNICFKEVTGNQEGIMGLHESDPLAEKLRTALSSTSTHKNAPRSLKMNNDEETIYLYKQSEFADEVKRMLVSCSVFEDIVESNYKSAALKVAKSFQEWSDLKKIIFIRDAGKVLSLHSTSQINSKIIQGKVSEEEIIPIINQIVFLFKNVYTDLEDNHYKQVCINLKTTLEVAEKALGDYKERFEQILTEFEAKNLDAFPLNDQWVPTFGAELESRFAEIPDANKMEEWADVYNNENIGVLFFEFLNPFKDAFTLWITAHKSICKKANTPKTGEQFLEVEKEAGIDLRAYISSLE